MSNQKLNDKQKALFEEWVKKDQELEASFPPLKGQQLSTRKVLPKRKLLEEYKKKIREAADEHS
ncbi:hypothetical protein MKC55_22580 [[Clostridium] innocuum]|jgi:hypothetical protein|uniref:hypothetical protein n=1 Tax=Bacteroides sp. TaxID=29523 RepID=UPI00204E5CBC|nr:hypothetical protein [[Clostridium] innocuum]MCR0514374.1 hypothetical protein [[Clostridium] innocuum]MCR0532133.1 hypothetical protein [[Clostridium] innocuum]DAH02733.1 MAG TPA: hypothetical protein [Caudoviricetes sp.]DAJ94934.1 MAG TPA: hypothetical protein [Caudoviricetes sp.]